MIKVFLILVMSLFSMTSYAKTVTSIDIINATVKAALKSNGSCFHYKFPTRFCVWLTPWMGRNVTPVLDHYLPDLIVMVYRNKDDNPWFEANLLLDKPSAMAQESAIPKVGSGNHSFLDEHEQQVIFKEADVIGNPALAIFPHYIGEVLLHSTAMPLTPYFQSMLDSALWRGFMPEALPEELSAITFNVVHHVGTGLTDWGGVYPHEGTVMGNNDAKASMVIAQRAADLLTNKIVYGHIHQELSTYCGRHCKAAAITENSQDILFQLIYPIEQTDCKPFGADSSYTDRMLNDKGVYMWIVWRHYQGCPNGRGKFIGVYP